MKEEIEQYKKEIQDLNNQLKDLVKAENTNEIIEQKLHDVTKVLELDYYLDQKPAQLSGGQRQRVALGRSIIGNPNLFLMDEPLSNLDAKLRATMRQKIRELHEKINSGTVYVTHDQIEAMTMADLIAVMTDGFVLQISNPNDLFKNPSCLFVASFVGSPEMNLFEGQFINNQFVSKKGVVWEIPKYKTNNLKPNQKIVFGIRPTDFSVDDSLLEAYKVQITTKIISKELLGNEILYRARIVTDKGLGDEIKFITSAYENYPLNSLQKIYPILSRIHLFDQETTISLTSELNLDTIKALRNWIGSADKIAIRTEILETAKVKSHKKSLVKQIYQKLRTSVINFKKSSTSINP
ncbi:ABC transporter ATP-binding protein [Mycoplasmoides fastidiosum]|nr:ABC transporter ATP-binding protein [Mycoplasmoides fastidiosum]